MGFKDIENKKKKKTIDMETVENADGKKEANPKAIAIRPQLGRIKDYFRESIDYGMDYVRITNKAIRELERRIDIEGIETPKGQELYNLLQACWKAQEVNVGFSKTAINIATIAPDVMDDAQAGDELTDEQKALATREQNKRLIMGEVLKTKEKE